MIIKNMKRTMNNDTVTYDNNHLPQYHRRFIPSWWGSEAIQGTLCPLGSQTFEQHVVKHQVTKSRHSHRKHQPNKGSKRRRARNQQPKWFQRCNFVTMNISRFLASEVSNSTQKPSWRASEPTGPGPKEAHSIWVSNLIFHTKHRTLGIRLRMV